MRGRAVAGVLVALPFAAMLATALVVGPRLGPVMASHWSSLGDPDGFTGTWSSFALLCALSGAATVGAMCCVGRARAAVLVLGIVAGATAAAWAVPAAATAVARTPESATLGPWLAVAVAPIGLAALAYRVLPPEAADDGPAPRLPVAPGDRLAFRATVVGAPLVAAAAVAWAVAGAAVVAAVLAPGAATAVAAIVLLLGALSVQVLVPARLTVDARGVRLVSAALRVPLIRVPPADVELVTVEAIEPWHRGGWGLRLNGSGRAYVARRGPGIVVHRRAGGAVAITVDDAETAAAVANAVLTPRPTP